MKIEEAAKRASALAIKKMNKRGQGLEIPTSPDFQHYLAKAAHRRGKTVEDYIIDALLMDMFCVLDENEKPYHAPDPRVATADRLAKVAERFERLAAEIESYDMPPSSMN